MTSIQMIQSFFFADDSASEHSEVFFKIILNYTWLFVFFFT